MIASLIFSQNASFSLKELEDLEDRDLNENLEKK
jgi:hypothetical protein